MKEKTFMNHQPEKILFRLLAVMALLLCGCQAKGTGEKPIPTETENTAETAKDSETIVLLHTNDVHCGLDEKIGYDGLYLYKEELEQQYDNILLVDAGDAIQGGIYGSLSKGDLIISLMNEVGYDCAILGNHEFDYGFDVLDDLSEKLNCGYICANFCTADGETVFEPYRLFERAGKTIALIGIVTPTAFAKSPIHSLIDDQGNPMYDFMSDETGERLIRCVQKNVDEVREKGADIVILLTHLGNGDGDDTRYHSGEVIQNTTGIDLVIDGHSHDEIIGNVANKDGVEVPITQTGTKLASIGKITILPDNTITMELVEEIPEPHGIDAELVIRKGKQYWVDSSIQRKTETLTACYQDVLNRKIGEITYDLPIRDGDTPVYKTQENGMCSLFADALRETGDAEAGLIVSANIREGLHAGEITYAEAVRCLPYGNDIIVISLKGQDLLDALEFGARKLPAAINGFVQVSGIEYTVNLSIPSSVKEDADNTFLSVDGPYRVENVQINGEPLDLEREYSVATSYYLYTAGDGMSMLGNGKLLSYTRKTDNEVLTYYIENTLNGIIPERYASKEGRIMILSSSEN
ncbi:MAG: bifunctional metallophosphatase/5'-nucleotidase [Solobacterium sp.]|nr:bifunctional metallophosphatase/5'-nucleotidase [Solobacterium sp.]